MLTLATILTSKSPTLKDLLKAIVQPDPSNTM